MKNAPKETKTIPKKSPTMKILVTGTTSRIGANFKTMRRGEDAGVVSTGVPYGEQ
jgi:hypothetical protein